MMSLFSEREGLSLVPTIKYRTDLPVSVRRPIIKILEDSVGNEYLRLAIHDVLDPYALAMESLPSSLANEPSVLEDEKHLEELLVCEWYNLFDLIEIILSRLDFFERELASSDECGRYLKLCRDLDRYFVYAGVGWKIDGGLLVARGDEVFERELGLAEDGLSRNGWKNARIQLKSAVRELSTRPEPNIRSAIYSAMGALESVEKEITSKHKLTLGRIVKQPNSGIPVTLADSIDKMWGYASDFARHTREDREVSYREAELVVSVCSSLIAFLSRADL